MEIKASAAPVDESAASTMDWLTSQWLALGVDCCEASNFEAAIEAFEQALKVLPDCPLALHGLGIAFNAVGAHADAIAPLEHLLAAEPLNGDAWGNYGHALAGLERYGEALAAYRHSLALVPEAPLSWYNCARVLFEMGRYGEAATACERARELSPEDALIWFWSGQVFRKLERDEQALAAFERSLAIAPEQSRAWNHRGVLLEAFGRHGEALASYDRAIALEPDYAEAWNNRGITLDNQGQILEALEAFQTSLRHDDRNPDAWNNYGLALAGTGRHGEAVTAYDRAILLTERQYWRAWVNRGWALLACQGIEAAQANWEAGLQSLAPEHPQGPLARGLLKYHQGRAYAAAVEAVAQGQAPPAELRQAWGHFSEALEVLTAAAFPHWRLEVLQDAIAVCRSLGDTRQMRHLLQEAMDLLRRLVRETVSTSKKVEYAARLASFYQLGGKMP